MSNNNAVVIQYLETLRGICSLLEKISYDETGTCVDDVIEDLKQSLAQPQAPVVPSFPDRDLSKSAEEQGLFRKFEVRRTDGSSEPGGKHEHCRYFVIDMDHDQHAPAALLAYSTSCSKTHPLLAAELRDEMHERALQMLVDQAQELGLYDTPLPEPAQRDEQPLLEDLRDTVLHQRGALAENGMTSDQVNDVLKEIDERIACAESKGKGSHDTGRRIT